MTVEEWLQEWYDRWFAGGLSEDEFPWDELPIVHESTDWVVTRAWRRTACENGIRDSRIWVKAPPDTFVDIDYEYGKGQAFDHPNIYGKTNERGNLWWANDKRTPGRMSVEVDGELLVENLRFDLGNEYCKTSRWPMIGNRANNRSGQYVYDITVERKTDDPV